MTNIHTNLAGTERLFPLGTRLIGNSGPYRYSRAAEELKAHEKAYFNLPSLLLAISPATEKPGDVLYGHISATGEEDALAGVPEVDIEPAQHFWLRETP